MNDEEENPRWLLENLTFRRGRLTNNSNDPPNPEFGNHKKTSVMKANLMCSDTVPDLTYSDAVLDAWDRHYLLLDCDYSVLQLESSTQGNSHLVFGRALSKEDMLKVLKVMSEVGLIQPNYYKSAKEYGYACLRTPGTNKFKTADRLGFNEDGNIESEEEYYNAQRAARLGHNQKAES